jgi:hypothetical protein
MNRHAQDQIAIFGHVSHATENKNASQAEDWLIVEQNSLELRLSRPAGQSKARLNNKCLLAVQLPGHSDVMLTWISSLCTHSDGSLHATARIFPGAPSAFVAEIRERPMGKISRQPAFLFPADAKGENAASIFLPAGTSARALSISLLQDRPRTLRLGTCLERGSDYERWNYEIL